MVNKILSGHDTSTNVAIQDLRSFDSQTRSTISSFQHHLFSTCHDLQAAQHDVNQAVLDVLTSTVPPHHLSSSAEEPRKGRSWVRFLPKVYLCLVFCVSIEPFV
ncbi:Hypothetical protein PHPALM_3407 [Phytophthora palmivora]|uniref:Uncharacterized protein n=1 Tax=Phytophthora palmivora TaxID=4796 RepID=A0A2P4YMG0_9STRA|nr:Hypothetical protein PHPALM_3407 [Phytophthora palmivora]